MTIRKWVDMGQDVDIDLTFHDIRGALAEAFANVTKDRLGEEGPSRRDVFAAFISFSQFLHVLTDEQIGLLDIEQRETIETYLRDQAGRFARISAAQSEVGS